MNSIFKDKNKSKILNNKVQESVSVKKAEINFKDKIKKVTTPSISNENIKKMDPFKPKEIHLKFANDEPIRITENMKIVQVIVYSCMTLKWFIN